MTDPTFKDRAGLEAEYAPCPTCRQYSHSIGCDAVTSAFNHFQSMYSHRSDGIPTQYSFDAKTRDAAQLLAAELTRLRAENEALRGMLLATGEAAATHLKRAMKAEESK